MRLETVGFLTVKGKPVAMRGRKAKDPKWTAWLPVWDFGDEPMRRVTNEDLRH